MSENIPERKILKLKLPREKRLVRTSISNPVSPLRDQIIMSFVMLFLPFGGSDKGNGK